MRTVHLRCEKCSEILNGILPIMEAEMLEEAEAAGFTPAMVSRYLELFVDLIRGRCKRASTRGPWLPECTASPLSMEDMKAIRIEEVINP